LERLSFSCRKGKSKVFFDQPGIGFSVPKVRSELAKKLVRELGLSLTETARRVGSIVCETVAMDI
jgi:hypothetical protein